MEHKRSSCRDMMLVMRDKELVFRIFAGYHTYMFRTILNLIVISISHHFPSPISPPFSSDGIKFSVLLPPFSSCLIYSFFPFLFFAIPWVVCLVCRTYLKMP